jgi:hypothetical protein
MAPYVNYSISDAFDALPASQFHVPVLTWETTVSPGDISFKTYTHIIGYVDDPTLDCRIVDRADTPIKISSITTQQPLTNDRKWKLVADRPIKVVVATMEATMCHLADTVRMYGGDLILIPVPYVR